MEYGVSERRRVKKIRVVVVVLLLCCVAFCVPYVAHINRNHKNNKNCYVSVCRYVCTNIYAAVVEVALFIGMCVYIFYLFTDIICIYYKYLFIILLRFSSVCSIFFVVCCCRVVSSMSVSLSVVSTGYLSN